MAELILHPQAHCDWEEAVLSYARVSKKAAQRFDAEVQQAREDIVRQPQTWPSVGLGLRRYLLRKFPYALIYRAEGDRIWLVAIADLRRRPGYWQERLQDSL